MLADRDNLVGSLRPKERTTKTGVMVSLKPVTRARPVTSGEEGLQSLRLWKRMARTMTAKPLSPRMTTVAVTVVAMVGAIPSPR